MSTLKLRESLDGWAYSLFRDLILKMCDINLILVAIMCWNNEQRAFIDIFFGVSRHEENAKVSNGVLSAPRVRSAPYTFL